MRIDGVDLHWCSDGRHVDQALVDDTSSANKGSSIYLLEILGQNFCTGTFGSELSGPELFGPVLFGPKLFGLELFGSKLGPELFGLELFCSVILGLNFLGQNFWAGSSGQELLS